MNNENIEIMYPIKKIRVGSGVFFDGLPGYNSHDDDELVLMGGGWLPCKDTVFRMPTKDKNGKKKDVFICKNLTKEEFIEDYLNCDTPMRGNRFLVPDFIEYIGLTINDLKRLKPKFDEMDEKHLYLLNIYNSYIENNGFFLTDKQKDIAFEIYKLKRK